MALDATLLLHCPDTKGIVFEVSQFIFSRGGNIIDAQQHREEIDNRFFMRVHFDAADMGLAPDELRGEMEVLAGRFHMEYRLGFSHERRKLAIFVSKYDHCLYDLLLRARYGELAGEVAVVVGNHSDLAPVARHFEVPFVHVPVGELGKEAAEARMLALMADYQIDLIVLARYMQVLTPILVDPYKNRIINVHHGFLPAFQGARPYHQAYAKGVKLIGATSHYVTADLDMGPIIEQASVAVNHSHSVKDLITMGRDIEKQVLAAAVKAHLDSRITVYRDRTIVFD